MKPLQGKVALVTGGSRGIGRAICLALAEAGADVAVNCRADFEAATQVVELIDDMDRRAFAYMTDVSREEDVHKMVEQIQRDLGRVSILVNNAGISRDKSFIKMTNAMWDEVMAVNSGGLFNVTHAVLPGMIDSGWGRVINISSIVGQIGNFGQANYAFSKGGMIAFTKTLAREVARKGITVNVVAPGFIETDLTKDSPPVAIEQIKAMTPVGRLGKPEEVADAVLWLAQPKSGYITGQVISVNGGMYM